MRLEQRMSLGKQAKILTKQQQNAVLNHLKSTRNPIRNKVIFLLSLKAGLRAKEIANLTWGMITQSDGTIAYKISLENKASKGKSGGLVWLNRELREALIELYETVDDVNENDRVIKTERNKVTNAQCIVNMFGGWYKGLGFKGCSSHSGRRTFITNASKKIYSAGGSMRDVQMLARHASLNMTMSYIEADEEAMKKVVDLV